MTPTITLPRAAAQQALEAIEDLRGYRADIDEAITALKAALAQQAGCETAYDQAADTAVLQGTKVRDA